MEKAVAQKNKTVTVPKLRTLTFASILIFLFVLLVLSITFAIMIGPVFISPGTIWRVAFSHLPLTDYWITTDWTTAHENIVWNLRFPRVLMAAIIGAGLAIVGAAIQALVRNSLADPYILGVSSGGSVGATLVITTGAFSFLGEYALSIAAFIGALMSVVLVFFVAQVGGRTSVIRLLLAGIAISMVLSAVTNFIVMTAPQEEAMRSAMFWMMGSLSGARWDNLLIPMSVVCIGIVFLLLYSRSLNALLMGEETAATLGISVQTFQKVLIVLTALVTGVMVAASGAIGFVGLMIPHIVRLVIGSDHRRLLPASALVGAIFLIWADVGARMVLAPEELPIGIVTALCGGPFFIWLLRRNSYSFGGGGK